MKKYEKYAEEIRSFGNGEDFCAKFVRPKILNKTSCIRMPCERCRMIQMLWLLEEYEEPEVDWSTVEVDTPILVKEDGDGLCMYTEINCIRCPLDWGAECCCDDDALFAKWYDATSIDEKAKIAKQIAELPEREVKDE